MPGNVGFSGLRPSLTDLTSQGNIWFDALLHLYSNPYLPNSNSQLGNFVESVWAGYQAQFALWQAIQGPDATNHLSQSASVTYGPNTSGAQQSVAGYFITDATGTIYLGGEQFAGGPVLIANNQTFLLTVTLADKSEF